MSERPLGRDLRGFYGSGLNPQFIRRLNVFERVSMADVLDLPCSHLEYLAKQAGWLVRVSPDDPGHIVCKLAAFSLFVAHSLVEG